MKKQSKWLILILLMLARAGFAQLLQTPESYFGFQLGSDYKIADWPQIVDYFHRLDEASPRIQVMELGKSTQGNPFILAVISSEENLQQIEDIQALSKRIASGNGLNDKALQRAASRGKAIVLITCSIHATELGAAQASAELAYKLVTQQDPRAGRILEDVVFLLVPSFNPDGLRMVKSWYDRYLNTPYEASRMPYLYHVYVGHDNNRDAFMQTQVESKLVNKVLYRDWLPQLYLDMHQMGNRSARLFIPPFADPVNPNLHPLIVRSNTVIGEYIATSLLAKGFTGVITGSRFTHWWQGGFLRTAWFHNIVGLLSEMASAQLATPIFQQKSDLRQNLPGANELGATVNYPAPWPGGWWRLRNIIDYEMEIAFSLLHFAALHKEELLVNKYRMAAEEIQKGKSEPPFAFVIPPDQWDIPEAYHFLKLLSAEGVEIHQAEEDFTADGIPYPKGSFVILMGQPYRPFIKDLLTPQKYPDIRAFRNGPPVPPYDNAGWTLSYQMGVKTVEIVHPFQTRLRKLRDVSLPPTKLPDQGKHGYLLSTRFTDSFKAINLALKSNIPVFRISRSFQKEVAGSFVLKPRNNQQFRELEKIAAETHLSFAPLQQEPARMKRISAYRLAVYQPWTANMHEGWSRWVLEQYNFPYETIHNAQIRSQNLRNHYDVIYLPDISAEQIFSGRSPDRTPPQYAGGIGQEGVENLRRFAEEGGVLITMDNSCELVTDRFALPVVNAAKGKKPEEFFCPGSILRIETDPDHELAYGMPAQAMSFFSRSQVLQIVPSFNQPVSVAVKYPRENLLASGYLIGEKVLAGNAGVVEIPIKKGKVILIGFDAINRAQAHSTFKLLFNAILLGGMKD